jgi:hypothetical protein
VETEDQTMMIRPFSIAVAVLLLLIVRHQAAFGQKADSTDLAQRILSAWKERSAKLNTFELSCSLGRTEQMAIRPLLPPTAPEPFGPAKGALFSNQQVELQSVFTLIAKGDKISMRANGQVWNDDTQAPTDQEYTRTFDGAFNKSLIVGREYKQAGGTVDNERRAASELAANTHYIPLWLSFRPQETLTRLGFDVAELTVTNSKANHKGKDCVEVAIPRDSLVCALYLDPSTGYLPVKYVEWRGVGKLRSEIEIEYVDDDRIGHVITKSTSQLYGSENKVETTLTISIKNATINHPINDNIFDIEMPSGTSVRETIDGKTRYYIVGQEK